MSNLVSLNGLTGSAYQIVITRPRSYDDMTQAMKALKDGKVVFMNVADLKPDLARRIVDFVAGGAHSIAGHSVKVGEGAFLFTPQAIQLTVNP